MREAGGERLVGQFLDGTPDEALAYFERKYADLAGQVSLLEQRVRRGAPASDISAAVSKLQTAVSEANAVGDLQALSTRLEALGGTVTELSEKHKREIAEAVEQAVAERTEIVTEIEGLAAQDPTTIQWKTTTARLDTLFNRWQEHQRSGPRLPRAQADDLWKRFRTARAQLEHSRKAFFAELDSQHREVRDRKSALIGQAEQLLAQGADAAVEYRRLLEQWKAAGRAGKKSDDALWEKFKAIGDAIYQAKAEVDAKENEEYEANLREKTALLDEAESLITESTPRDKARAALASLHEKWDTIGRVQRNNLRQVEERLRRIENTVRKREDDFWERNNPEKKARSNELAHALNAAIENLEDELARAQRSGDQQRITAAAEALDARRGWLGALDKN